MILRERWRDVVCLEGMYQVSDYGKIRSLDRDVECKSKFGNPYIRRVKGKIMSCPPNSEGYPHGCFRDENGFAVWFLVHKLVMEAFIGPTPKGKEVCHNDGDPSNPKLKNLRFGTRTENMADMVIHGTHMRGEKNHRAVLNEEQVLEIRRQMARGENRDIVAKAFKVHPANIDAIVKRKSWKHL